MNAIRRMASTEMFDMMIPNALGVMSYNERGGDRHEVMLYPDGKIDTEQYQLIKTTGLCDVSSKCCLSRWRVMS